MGRTAVVVATLALAASTARGDLVVISATRDATLYESPTGSLGNGAGEFLFAGRSNQGLARRGLLWFDVGAFVPEGATITSARVTLNLVQIQGGTRTLRLHRATRAWTTGASNPADNEGGGAPALAGDATWLHASADGAGGGIAWTAAGGDFASVASATFLSASLGQHVWESASLASDVQAALATRDANLGWFLLGDESVSGTSRRFDSADGAPFGGFAPRLEIEFTSIPAPGALATGLLALPSAGRRRRR